MNTAMIEHRWSGDGRTPWSTLVLSVCLLATLLLAPVTADASEPAGRVIFSAGTVTATDDEGFSRPLSRHDVVYPGETIDTGERARAEIRMRDNALFSLDAETRFALERYGYEAEGGSAIMSFLRGTLRTITGALGKGKNETYQMITPVATIGVRGTQYALQWCDAACARPNRPAGLYGHVDEGTISVTNEAASELMTRADYFHVADSDVAPRRLLQPPEGILGVSDSRGDGDGGSDDYDYVERPDGTGLLTRTSGDLLTTTSSLLDATGSLLASGGELVDTSLTGTLSTTTNLLGNGGDLVGSTLTNTLQGDLVGTGDALVSGTTNTANDLVNDSTNMVDDTVDGIEDTTGDLTERLFGF